MWLTTILLLFFPRRNFYAENFVGFFTKYSSCLKKIVLGSHLRAIEFEPYLIPQIGVHCFWQLKLQMVNHEAD